MNNRKLSIFFEEKNLSNEEMIKNLNYKMSTLCDKKIFNKINEESKRVEVLYKSLIICGLTNNKEGYNICIEKIKLWEEEFNNLMDWTFNEIHKKENDDMEKKIDAEKEIKIPEKLKEEKKDENLDMNKAIQYDPRSYQLSK